MPRRSRGTPPYDKTRALEHIFLSKIDTEHPQEIVGFTRQDVAAAIVATGGEVPHNLNNFVKDLCRYGNSDPRVEVARKLGYRLRESTSAERTFGEFYLAEGQPEEFVVPSEGLEITEVPNGFMAEVLDIVRPDEGGVNAAIEACHLLDHLLGLDPSERRVLRVQSPVKLQPYEVDGLWLLVGGEERILIPVEAKSGRDVITMNQIYGITRTALESVAPGVIKKTIPVGTKILPDGDIYMVAFASVDVSQLGGLETHLRSDQHWREARFRLVPLPPKWMVSQQSNHRQASGERPPPL